MAQPKGAAKTGGRRAGTPNKVTADVKAAALGYTVEAINGLVARGRDVNAPAAARVSAWKEILDRAVGKAPQAIIGGDDGAAPIAFSFKLDRPIARIVSYPEN